MSKLITERLQKRLHDLAGYDAIEAETRYNSFKEELQFYMLNFIYHHPEYSKWIMYGGSALRIIHKLDRMSVDLDFEVSHSITDRFLTKLKKEIGEHFKITYGAETDFLTIKINNKRGLTLKFRVNEKLGTGHPSKWVHVKIDLNHFVLKKAAIERRPINRDQMSFVILTYNMSTLMASKLAAIFLRGTREVGISTYEEKGRDIYDLLWYMNKQVVPDLDYLNAKNVGEAKDLRTLFDKLTIKMNRVNENNLKHDLSPLFVNRTYIENWLKNWRESYLNLVASYKIRTVTDLDDVGFTLDSNRGILGFEYLYKTAEGGLFFIKYLLSDYWIKYQEGELTIPIDEDLIQHMTPEAQAKTGSTIMKQKRYATLFYKKTEKYFKKTGRIILGNNIVTKLIRMTADNLNQEEQIVLNKSALLSCELDDLLK